MGSIVTIARRDFLSYFSTAKGGAVFWFFLAFMGFFFNSFIHTFLEMQNQAPRMGGQGPTLEQMIQALFYNIHFILLFVIPTVTMSTFSEEKRSLSIRMLQTAPVTPVQIVLGKFFGAFSIMSVVLICSMAYPLFTMMYGNPDVGPIWTGYLGVALLIASQVAFGIWISSMTESPLMSFLFTLFGLFLLLILNWIAPSVSGGGQTEEFFKYLASTTHLDPLFKGVVAVSDVTYFLCFTSLFLFFTTVVIDSQRWR